MAFIRAKKHRSGRSSHYIVEAVREGAKVRQRALVCIGDDVCIDDAIETAESDLASTRKGLESAKAEKQRIESDGHPLPETWDFYRERFWMSRRRSYFSALANIAKYERRIPATEKRLALLRELQQKHGNLIVKSDPPPKRRAQRIAEAEARMAEIMERFRAPGRFRM